MSHRTALTLSIALTLILAVGILVGRDRLFTAEASPGTATAHAPAVSGETLPAISRATSSDSAPRVIEIPLPVQAQQDESRPRSGDIERSEHERVSDDTHDRGSYGEDHEGEDDD